MNHPLDNGIVDLRRIIRDEATRHGLEQRVFFVETGKMVPLLEQALSATAINSTACHQALLRGIPTMVLGRAVFNHQQIVPRMRLADFFRLRRSAAFPAALLSSPSLASSSERPSIFTVTVIGPPARSP